MGSDGKRATDPGRCPFAIDLLGFCSTVLNTIYLGTGGALGETIIQLQRESNKWQ